MGTSRSESPAAQVWAALYDTYYNEVRNYFASQIGRPHDAEDLAQDVFAGIVRRGGVPRNSRVYIYTVAKNRLRRYWRERARDAGTTCAERPDDVTGTSPGALFENELGPLQQLLRKESGDVVRGALSHIPPALAKAFELRFLDGLPPGEVARRLGCTPSALKKRLQRAKRLVAESCEHPTESQQRPQR